MPTLNSPAIKTRFVLLFLGFFSVITYSHKAEAILEVNSIPNVINMSNWSGSGDLFYSSDPFNISSVENNKASAFSIRTQSNRARSSKLALYASSSGQKQLLPITITLRQLSNGISQTLTESNESSQPVFYETEPRRKDFRFEFQATRAQLSLLRSGTYSNHFTVYFTNVNGETKRTPLMVSLQIPNLIKIGFSSDVFIKYAIGGDWHRGTGHVCVFVNDHGWYRAKALSANYQQSQYHLCKGRGGGQCQSGKIPYYLIFQGQRAPQGPTFRFTSPEGYSPWFKGSQTYFEECTKGISNARIHADVRQRNIALAPHGEYSDVVTIIVTPD